MRNIAAYTRVFNSWTDIGELLHLTGSKIWLRSKCIMYPVFLIIGFIF